MDAHGGQGGCAHRVIVDADYLDVDGASSDHVHIADIDDLNYDHQRGSDHDYLDDDAVVDHHLHYDHHLYYDDTSHNDDYTNHDDDLVDYDHDIDAVNYDVDNDNDRFKWQSGIPIVELVRLLRIDWSWGSHPG